VLVFVGDALEEPIDSLAKKAGELGLLGVKIFIFQEGRDPKVERGFRELAPARACSDCAKPTVPKPAPSSLSVWRRVMANLEPVYQVGAIALRPCQP